MSVDDTLQPEEPAHQSHPSSQETGERAAPPLESTSNPTDTEAAPEPATASPETPSPAPHVTPAIDPAPPSQLPQSEQAHSEPSTPVYTGASQATPTQPPSPVASPSALNTPTAPPVTNIDAQQPPAQQKRGRGCSLLALISAICIVALLASGSYFLFNLLNSHTESDVARIVPSGTVAFVSVDLVAAAAQSHHITAGDLASFSGQSDTFGPLAGLDWDKDVLPWAGRHMAFAVFQRQMPYGSPNEGQSAATLMNTGTLGNALLLQSHDDGAAQAAMRKAATYQQSHGFNVVTLDYRGLKLYHISLLQGDESGTTLAAGRGWVVVASDLPAARKLVDGLTGNSSATDSLAMNTAYRNALGTLPASRFGTVFLDTHSLVKSFVYSSPMQIDMASTLAATYPTAIGYLAWTSDGLRAQLTFPSARNLDIRSLSGDTTTLANLTPASAFAYSGIANLGATLSAQESLTSQSKAPGTARPFFGLAPSDPALQQPAAFSLIGEPQGATGFLALLHAPDRADALAMVQQSAEQQHWTLKTTKIAGVSATAYYEKLPPTQTTTNASPGIRLVGMVTWLNNTLIAASDATVLTDAIHTIRDHAPNLAQDAHFQQLVREAPGGGCATTFLDLSRAAAAANAANSMPAASLAEGIQAIVVTHTWTGHQYQATVDLLLLT